MSLSLGLMIGGALVAVLGGILVFTKLGSVKILFGIVLAVFGLGAIGVGYTLDQFKEVTYSVVEANPVSPRDDEDQYRVTLRDDKGISTWIYVNQSQLDNYQSGTAVTMKKSQLRLLQESKVE
ncbi:MAG: hypothetical protein IKN55_03415 [Oscillospiraceae bacterium]|nr:hypothetical protein [Oscillospiraceae bacterium]